MAPLTVLQIKAAELAYMDKVISQVNQLSKLSWSVWKWKAGCIIIPCEWQAVWSLWTGQPSFKYLKINRRSGQQWSAAQGLSLLSVVSLSRSRVVRRRGRGQRDRGSLGTPREPIWHSHRSVQLNFPEFSAALPQPHATDATARRPSVWHHLSLHAIPDQQDRDFHLLHFKFQFPQVRYSKWPQNPGIKKPAPGLKSSVAAQGYTLCLTLGRYWKCPPKLKENSYLLQPYMFTCVLLLTASEVFVLLHSSYQESNIMITSHSRDANLDQIQLKEGLGKSYWCSVS